MTLRARAGISASERLRAGAPLRLRRLRRFAPEFFVACDGGAGCRRVSNSSSSLPPRFGLLLGDQRLTVGDRDLVIVGMDFREGEEALAVAAIFDEGRLQRRLNARHLGEIDVSFERPLGGGLEIKFLDLCRRERRPGSPPGGWRRSACAWALNSPCERRLEQTVQRAGAPRRKQGGSRNGVWKPEHCPMRCFRFGGAIGSGSVCHLILNFWRFGRRTAMSRWNGTPK